MSSGIYSIGTECLDMTPLTRDARRLEGSEVSDPSAVARKVQLSGDEILSLRQNLSAGAPVYVKG